jgi:hypothetical protein
LSLAEKLKTTQRSQTGLPCGVGKLLSELSGDDKEALEIVFSTPSRRGTISNVQIHKILLSENYDVSFASVRLHRQKICRCYVGQNNLQRQEA